MARNDLNTNDTDEINLKDIVASIWLGKWIVLLVTILCTSFAVFYSLSLPNMYKSEVTLVAADEGGAKMPGQLGGLAALAGVNLGNMAGGEKAELGLEILKSRDFIGRFIEENDLYIPIMAAKGWERESDQLIIDSDIYDIKSRTWIRKVKPPYNPKPSIQETIEEFKKNFIVERDKTSGIITVSILNYSPKLAKNWIDIIVKSINEEIRNRDLREAERSIEYLNSQIITTNLAEVRNMLFSLIEEQTKTVMLANVREEYVFKTVDPALEAEKRSKPNRVILILLVALISSVLSSFIVVIRYLNRDSN